MTGRPEFLMGTDAALVLKYGGSDQSVVKGLNTIKLPELMREVVKVEEFRRDFDIEFTTGGSYGRFGGKGNLVLGDNKGQDQLKAYLKANEKFSDFRYYLNLNDFVAMDLARDPDACVQVVHARPGETSKKAAFTFEFELTCGGDFAYFVRHLDASTLAFVATGRKITDSANGLVDAGFAAGQTLIVEGSAANSGQHIIESVAAGEIVLTEASTITDEAEGAAITLHGGTL